MPTKGTTGWLAPVRRPSCYLLDLPGDHPNGDPATYWRIRDAGPETSAVAVAFLNPGALCWDTHQTLLARAGPGTLKLSYPRDPDASHLAI